MRRCLALLVFLLLAFGGRTAWAQVLIPDEPSQARPLRINSQQMSVKVHDRIAVTTIDQEFFSAASQPVTAMYVFPMPREATITSFSYWVRGHEVRGKLLSREEAEKRFTHTAASGRSAAVLQGVDKITFQCRIAPVLPDTVTRVRIEYLQALPYVRNEVTLLLPLKSLGLETSVSSLKVRLEVQDQLPIEKFSSPTHGEALRLHREGTGAFSGELNQQGGALADQLKVSYRLRPQGLGTTLLTYREKGKPGYFLLQFAPTSTETKEIQVARDIVFVFDRSGSMAGEKIEQAKQAFRLGMDGLRPGDRFDLITYNSEIRRIRDTLSPATAETLGEASAWVDGLTAEGGTNLHDALLSGLGLIGPSQSQKLLVFLTDGLPTVGVTDKETIVRDVTEANKNQARIFSWGVGRDADDVLLAQISQHNFATAEHYAADEVIEAKLRAFYQRAGHPIMLDPRVSYGAQVRDVIPERLPDLYHGVNVTIVGRYESSGRERLTVHGVQGKDAKTEDLGLQLPETDTRYPFIAQLWARSRAAELVRAVHADGEQKSLVEQVVRLSKDYSVLTPYTTYFAEAPKEGRTVRAGGSGELPPPALVGQTQFAVAGDPRIVITAPPGTRSVAALLPWGDRFDLVRTAGTDRWSGRFILPAGTPDGSYDVRLLLVGDQGRVSWRSVRFSAVVHGPQGTVETGVERVRDGWQVSLTVHVGPGVAQAFAVRQGSPAVPLRRVGGREYFARVFVPKAAGRPDALQVILLDTAHNRRSLPIHTGATPIVGSAE